MRFFSQMNRIDSARLKQGGDSDVQNYTTSTNANRRATELTTRTSDLQVLRNCQCQWFCCQ